MSKFKNILLSTAAVLSAGLMATSCSDWLDLEPEDFYGSGSYWKNESHVLGYIDGLHKHLRDAIWQHTIIFGEIRGGQYVDGVSSDGMTTSYGDMRLQKFDADHTGVSKFGDLYGRITNCNLLIARVKDASFLTPEKRDQYMAVAYGLRALYYFDLYRVYGGVPLRDGVEVIDGVLDPTLLYMGRSTPKQTMDFIKSDIQKSIELFGSNKSLDPFGRGKNCYWNLAASECLAAEIYMWTGKVTCFDNKANEADLQVAKKYLKDVESNFGREMLADFTRVFDAHNKENNEIIFAVRFAEGEATNGNNSWTYSNDTGSTKDAYREDGTPWNDPLGLKNGSNMSMQYRGEMFHQFDKADSRRNGTFMASYNKDAEGNLSFRGAHTVKNIGYINMNGNRVYCGDYILYRLPWVYLSLAEIANMEGDNATVEKYVNMVRKRAYAENWDADKFGYKAGDFTQNELAIFGEKNKEFIQEGQRWWDLLRMTYTKGGDALVYHQEVSYDAVPILGKDESYKVLWPLDKTILNNDTELLQTPGYGGDECQW